MKLETCIQELELTLVNEASLDKNVDSVYIGDLLSMVMRKANEETLWLTVQTHVNAVAVAEMLDFTAIIFVEGLTPDEDAVNKANTLDIPLFVSQDDAYTLAKKIAVNGL